MSTKFTLNRIQNKPVFKSSSKIEGNKKKLSVIKIQQDDFKLLNDYLDKSLFEFKTNKKAAVKTIYKIKKSLSTTNFFNNLKIKTGNDLIFELPFINTKFSLFDNVFKYSDTESIDHQNINYVLNLLNIDTNLNDFNIDLQKQLKKITEINIEDQMVEGGKKKKKGGVMDPTETLTSYLENHHIFDNKHDFKKLCTTDSFCKDFVYSCQDLITGHPLTPLSATYVRNQCLSFDQNKLFMDYINEFTNNNLNNLIYVSLLDLHNSTLGIGINVFGTGSVVGNINYSTNLDNFMKQFTHTDNPKFITDGKLARNSSSNITSFLNEILIKYPQTQNIIIPSIIPSMKQVYDTNFIPLYQSFNDYITSKRIYSLEDVNDPLSVNIDHVNNFFNNPNPSNGYNSQIKELLANITYNMNNDILTSDNIFTNLFCKTNFEYVYYIDTLDSNKFKFALKLKDQSFVAHIGPNIPNFNFLNLIKLPSSNIYQNIPSPSSNSYVGFDLYLYRNYNSNKLIAKTINSTLKRISELSNQQAIDNYIENTLKRNDINAPGQTSDNKIAKKAAINLLIYYYVKLKQGSFNNPYTINQHVKEMAKILFDLKKAGDLSKVLFIYTYYKLKDSNQNTQQINDGLKEFEDNFVQDQLILSSNDTMAVLSSILRNKNDVFFSIKYNYSFCAFKAMDHIKVTIFDFFNTIKINFGSKFSNDTFNIEDSLKTYLKNLNPRIQNPDGSVRDISDLNKLILKLHDLFFNNPKSLIIKDKDSNDKLFESIIQLLGIQQGTYEYQLLSNAIRIYMVYYFTLVINNFNSEINNLLIKDTQGKYISKLTSLLFESIYFNDDVNSSTNYYIIFNSLTKLFVAKIYKIITDMFSIISNKIRSLLLFSIDTSFTNIYQEIMNILPIINKIISLIENFLYINIDNPNENTNIFTYMKELNSYTRTIINMSLVVKSGNINLRNINDVNNYEDIDMYVTLFSTNTFSKMLTSLVDIRSLNTTKLYNNLFTTTFINNLTEFMNFYKNIDAIKNTYDFDTTNEFSNLLEKFKFQFKKFIYFVFIQYCIPYYGKIRSSTDTTFDYRNVIADIFTKIKFNINESFESAKQELVTNLTSSSNGPIRKSNRIIEAEKRTIIANYDAKNTEILSKIDDVKLKIDSFYEFVSNDINIDRSQLLFFVSNITINNETNFKVNIQNLNDSDINSRIKAIITYQYNLDRFTGYDINTSTSTIVYNDNYLIFYNIFNFLIDDRFSQMRRGGLKKKKLLKYH